MFNNHLINTLALIAGVLACYYVAATVEQDYECHDDTSCFEQCIEFGDPDCE